MIDISWKQSLQNAIKNTSKDLMLFDEVLSYSLAYYISSYECPICNNSVLYKMRVRGANTIFKGKTYSLFNLFTCPDCKVIYASITETNLNNYTNLPLSSFALLSEKYSTIREYKNVLDYTVRFQQG
jgi:DNA-directed RNA polymerase subunit RPC12/RpoP